MVDAQTMLEKHKNMFVASKSISHLILYTYNCKVSRIKIMNYFEKINKNKTEEVIYLIARPHI